MTKIITSLFILFTASMLWAGGQGNCHNKLPLMENELERQVARQTTPDLAWKQQLKNLQALQAKVHLHPDRQGDLPAFFQTPLSYQEEQLYLKRLLQVQKSVNAHASLQGFTFVAPVAADLAHLTADNYAALHAFLKDLKIVQVRRTECARPFTLALRITGQNHSALEVWVDVPSKKMYLMSDNFYTTATGKYSLHLK